MAGKSPWGSSGGSSGGGRGSGGDSGDGGDEPSGGGESGDGPRNPWIPGGGSSGTGDRGRRSASIEDIFKNRGPEGPRRRGGGPGGPNLRFPERPGGKSWLPVIILGAVGLAIIGTSTHLIGPQEQAVVKTLGNYTRTLEPGLRFSAPFPIETVDVEDVRGVRALSIPGTGEGVKLILTGDQNLVDLSYIVRWNIKDLEQFKFRVVEPINTVAEAAEAAMRAAIAEKNLEETFTGQGRAEIQQDVRERMQATLDSYNAGISVLGVEIEKADPPAEVVDAFRDVQVAEQNADAARNQARGYAEQVLAQAEGEAQAFDKVYEEYRLAPRVTRQRLYYETMERILSQTDKTIVETGGVTPYLPLPEVNRRRKTESSSAQGGQ
ncbi:protease modulator HflK [Altererythrobacter sp. GH1-8]|uniref:protease modulator HflK n=1 Tax=Altererythrobacter sp. GH1-8 TaxID=3349333 RepID=UPI00374CA96D